MMFYVQEFAYSDANDNVRGDLSTTYDSGTETASVNKYRISGENLSARNTKNIPKTTQLTQIFSVLHRLNKNISENLCEMESQLQGLNYQNLMADNALLRQTIIEKDNFIRQIQLDFKTLEKDNEQTFIELNEHRKKNEKLKKKLIEKNAEVELKNEEVKNLSEKLIKLETEHNKRINVLMKSQQSVEQKDDFKVKVIYIAAKINYLFVS